MFFFCLLKCVSHIGCIGSEPLNSCVLAQLLFPPLPQTRNVLREVLDTSETKQEEGVTLNPPAR